MAKYFLELRIGHGGGEYRIVASNKQFSLGDGEKVVWSRPYLEDEDLGEYLWPKDMRAEYEKLTGEPEFKATTKRPFNIVPLLAEGDVAYDCPCAWAQHVKGHAVYCENDGWLYSPRKCRRGIGSWDGTPLQETCPGFRKNETSN